MNSSFINDDDTLSTIRGRAKTFKKRYGINKDFLEESDLGDIMQKMNITDITKDDLKILFEKLDEKQEGKVSVDKFIEYVNEFQNNNDLKKGDSIFTKFYSQISGSLITQSEKIISKLKGLREKATFSKDEDSIDEINWIINALSHELYEPDIDTILNKTESSEMKGALDFIVHYSHAEEQSKRAKDVALVKEGTKMKTSSYLRLNSVSNRHDSILRNNSRSSTVKSDLSIELAVSVDKILNQINCFDFNIFQLNEVCGRKSLLFILNEIFTGYNYFESLLDEEKFKRFVFVITDGYSRNVAYHNDLHSADVTQTVYTIVERGNLIDKLKLNDLDIIALILSATCHDYKHNGFNNNFHVNDKTDIAITYNDSSVLENFHVAETFKVLIKEECNLLHMLQPEEWRLIRRRMIDCILSTDMASHTKHLAAFKNKLETFDIKNGMNIDKMINPESVAKSYDNQQIVLGMIVHCADISNPAKPSEVNEKWIKLVFTEFFNQGDVEKSKGLQVSLLCDRETTNINKSQIGFINFVVMPTFEALLNITPEINPYMEYIKMNLRKFESIVQEEEDKRRKDSEK